MKGCVGVHTQMNMEARGQCPIASSSALNLTDDIGVGEKCWCS